MHDAIAERGLQHLPEPTRPWRAPGARVEAGGSSRGMRVGGAVSHTRAVGSGGITKVLESEQCCSDVHAEGSGVMPQDCSNVSGTRGSRKEAALPSYNPKSPLEPKVHSLGAARYFSHLDRPKKCTTR